MRHSILPILLSVALLFGAGPLGGTGPNGSESSSAPDVLPNLDAVEPGAASIASRSRGTADTTGPRCPVGPKEGNITIQIDSSKTIPQTVTVEPDSQLAAQFSGDLASEMKLVAQADLNRDGRQDPIVKAQYEYRVPADLRRLHMGFVRCYGNRYVSVTPPLPLDMDRVRKQLSEETTWPDLTTLKEVKLAQKLKGYYYHQTYRFNEEKGRYQLVSGSAQYKKESARRLGIDPDNRPKCNVGEGPPIRIQSAGETQNPPQAGKSVSIKPIYKNEHYKIEWIGDLNSDAKNDLIVNTGCSNTGRCTYYIYSKCSSGELWYSKVSDMIISGKLTPQKRNQ